MNNRMKMARDKRGYSMTKVAEMIGISDSAYSRLEKGVNNPSKRTVELFCQKLNISESWLRTGEGEMEIPAPSDLVEQLARENNLSPAHVALLRAVSRAFAELDEEAFNRIMDELLADLQAAAAARSVVVADPSSRQVDPQSPADQPSSSSLPGSVVG